MRRKKDPISDVQQEIEVTTSESKGAYDLDKEQDFGELTICEKDEEVIPSVTKKREPKCTKCRNHNKLVAKKNHKGFCPNENCNCPKCRNIDERREVLKTQVRLRRKLEQEEKGIIARKRDVYQFSVDSVPAQPLTIQIPKPSVSFVPMHSSLPSLQSLQSHPFQYSQISYLNESSNPQSLLTSSHSSTSHPEFEETQETEYHVFY